MTIRHKKQWYFSKATRETDKQEFLYFNSGITDGNIIVFYNT